MTSTNGILAAAAGLYITSGNTQKVGADIILALSVLKDRYPVNQKSISKKYEQAERALKKWHWTQRHAR